MDSNLMHSLERGDMKKQNRNKVLASKEDKATKRRLRYDTYRKAQRSFLAQHKSSLAYGSGITITVAKKAVKNSLSLADRNLSGTSKSMLRCNYHHPKYFKIMGHRNARSKTYFANVLSV